MSRRTITIILILIISMTALIPVNIVADSNSAVRKLCRKTVITTSRQKTCKKKKQKKNQKQNYYRCERIDNSVCYYFYYNFNF